MWPPTLMDGVSVKVELSGRARSGTNVVQLPDVPPLALSVDICQPVGLVPMVSIVADAGMLIQSKAEAVIILYMALAT